MSLNTDAKPFHLRTVLQCHSMDTRSVSGLANGGFVTGSRDRTCKAYLTNKKNKFIESQCFIGPEHYVSSVCCLNNGEESLIYVGSNDSIIYCFSLQLSEPKCKLTGHSGTVCSLNADNKRSLILSGSWDNSARLWKNDKCIAVFEGHDGAVWGNNFIGDLIITASADKTLKLWKWEPKVECVKTIEGHTDCVRGVTVLSDTQFLSCSNDATVRHWDIDGQSLGVYYGHDNYIYSISAFNDHEYVTCGEDKTARYWNGDKCVQTIQLPAPTLWAVTALVNGDFVIAASNGKVYIYTRDESLKATEEEQKALDEELAKSTQQTTDIGDIKVSDLPGIEVLYAPGTKDGQTKLVRDGAIVTVHQWVAQKCEWVKIGDVVGAAGNTHDPSQKEMFEGKEYDYVFNIDIEDGVPPLKLPYNIAENPFMAAQEFIHKHDLSQLYLDQIANFIIKNSK